MESEDEKRGDHVVVVEMGSRPPDDDDEEEEASTASHRDEEEEEISPLLGTTQPQPQSRPKINIFSLSYSRRNPREQVKKVVETEVPLHYLFVLWIWTGSKYSGFLCMALSASIYFLMHIVSDTFLGRPIPLIESVFTRCTIILLSSFVWLRRAGQPVFGPPHLRSLLASRALMGCLSMFSFIYSVQRLPLSQAIVLNFTTPIMSSIAARVLLQEKLKLADVGDQDPIFEMVSKAYQLQLDEIDRMLQILEAKLGIKKKEEASDSPLKTDALGKIIPPNMANSVKKLQKGLACSFFGMLFIFRPMLSTQVGLAETGEATITFIGRINHPIYAVCAGLFSSIIGGISYCLIRSGAKASDQPVVTVFSFGILACPVAAIWAYSFQDLLLPNFYSFLLMIVLGVLSFFAEVFLARGLQLEKTSRVANIQYIEVVLLQMWSISLSRTPLSFGRLAGCLLILVSIAGTVYFGNEKEMA